MAKTLPKKIKKQGIETASGDNMILSSFITALGTLLTGQTNINDPSKLIGQVKGKGTPKSQNVGILGLLSKLNDNINIIIGGIDNKDTFKNYWNYSDKNQKFLNENVLTKDFTQNIKDIPLILKDVKIGINNIFESLNNQIHNEKSESSESKIKVSGGSDFAQILEAVKDFTYDKDTRTSLERFAKDTNKNGSIGQIFSNINDINEMNVDVDKFKKNLDKINEANSSTATAVGNKKTTDDLITARENLEGYKDFIIGVIGVGLLFVVVGLLADKIDFVGVLKFAGVLLLFVTALTGVYVLASSLLKQDGIVMRGIDEFMSLVSTSAFILLVGSFVMKFVDVKSILLFTTTLSIFISLLIRPFKKFEEYSAEHDLSETFDSITRMIAVSAFIMMVGSYAMEYINFCNLILFTLTLSTFLFTVLGVFALVSKWYGDEGQDSMKDAFILIAGSTFLMFLGAAVIPVLNIKNLIKFTVVLGMFLFVTLGVITLASKIFRAEGKGAYKDALFLIVGSAFIMFLGASIMPHLETKYLFLFTITLGLFLTAVMAPFLLLRPMIEHVKSAAVGMTIIVTMSAGILLIGGGLFMKYPDLADYTIQFGLTLSGFMLVMTGIVALLARIPSSNLTKATIAMMGVSATLLIVCSSFLLLADVIKRIDGVGGMEKFKSAVWLSMAILGTLTAGIVALGLALGNPVMTVMVTAAIALVLSASAAFGIIALSYLGIATALEKLSKIGNFDVQPLIDNTKKIIGLMVAMKEIIPYAIPLMMVESSMMKLADVMSKMANTVKNYADLKIPVYSGTKIIGYRHLKESDFTNAATNIGKVVTTLSEGIMGAYKQHKEWYGVSGDGFWKSLGELGTMVANGGKTPIQRVISQSKLLAPLISRIGYAVKSFADLKVPIYSGTKVVGYRHLESSDFEKASTNISNVVTTLSAGIMKAYEAHKEWYGAKDWSSFFNMIGNGGSTPLQRVISQSMKLSKLISKIGHSVENISKLKIADKWDSKTGDPTHYRLLTENDFKNASSNTKRVITTLSYSLMDLYKDHKDWYSGTGFLKLGDTPLEKVIKTNVKLSKLISEVASSIKDYAKLKMPTKYNNEGKAIRFEVMNEQHFIDAGKNIALVLTTLGEGIMTIYNDPDKKDWYKSGGFLGLGSSPFEKVIKTNTKLSKLISTVASNIKDYANLKMPKYDNAGKIVGYENMEERHFIQAGSNITRVLTTIAFGLLGYTVDEKGNTKPISGYDEYKKIFDNKDEVKKFNKILDASVKMSSIISEMAKGISNFSKMRFPKKFNDKGQPIEFEQLQPTTFTTAANCITTVITTVANALINVEAQKEKMWDVKNFEKSPLYNILIASEKMGKGISSIAKSLAEYANMKFPTSFDKNGNAIGYQRLSEGDLVNAASKITGVITLVAGTIYNIYEGKDIPGVANGKLKELWETKENFLNIGGEPTSPFEKVLNACVLMGQMIESIAKGISMYASGNLGTEEKPVNIDQTTLDLAKKSITDVLSNSAIAISGLSNETLFQKSEEEVEKLMNSLMMVTNLISSSAKNVQMFASLQIPDKWDPKTGKPIHYTQMKPQHFTEASNNIKTVMTTIAEAFNDSISKSEWLNDIDDSAFSGSFWNDKPKRSSSTIVNAMNAIMAMANTLSVMAGCIYGYSKMKFPKGVEKNGSMIFSEKLSYTDINAAKDNIVIIINSLGQAATESLDNVKAYKIEDINKISDFTTSITEMINNVLKSVDDMTKTDTVKNISTLISNLDILHKNLGTVTSKLAKLLYILFDEQRGTKSTTDRNGNVNVAFLSFVDLIKEYSSSFEGSSQKVENFIESLTSIIGSISKLNEPLNKSTRNINSLYNIFTKDDYVHKVDTIIFSMSQLLNSVKSIMNFDSIIADEEEKNKGSFFSFPSNMLINDEEKSKNEISNIIDRLKDYSELMIAVTDTFKKINENIADVKLDNYANFSMLTHFILELNTSLSSVNTKSLKNFNQQATQLDKFVKTVNSIKLSNLTNLNKFVNSLNQLASRMGNLDRLTDAIANKLSKVLEKLVERLVSAETTIVKADEIQKRRHQLIEKSVKEVSELMKQPMTVEIKQVDTPEPQNDEDQEKQ